MVKLLLIAAVLMLVAIDNGRAEDQALPKSSPLADPYSCIRVPGTYIIFSVLKHCQRPSPPSRIIAVPEPAKPPH
jgi:hypothetical protein